MKCSGFALRRFRPNALLATVAAMTPVRHHAPSSPIGSTWS